MIFTVVLVDHLRVNFFLCAQSRPLKIPDLSFARYFYSTMMNRSGDKIGILIEFLIFNVYIQLNHAALSFFI